MPEIELGTYLRSPQQQRYHACLEACVACWVACEMCSDACLDEPDVGEMVRCIRLDRKCAEACQAAVRAMVRGSEAAPQVCRLCAELCDLCAAECARHHHEHCRICAETCRRCAQECRRMVA
jgi:hypothetical protein